MNTQTFHNLLKRFLFLPLILMFGAITIIGSGGGGGDDGGGGGGTTDTLVFTANDNIDWVALQDGDGAWSKIEPDVAGGNVYTNTIQDAAGRYGIAGHEVGGNVHSVIVLQSTLAELANVTLRPSTITHQVTVTAANLAFTTNFSISRDDINVPAGDRIVFLNAVEGIRDLVAIENPVPPTRGVISRDNSINAPTGLIVDFDTDVNVTGFTAHNFNITPQPTNTNLSGYVKFVTANQTISHAITMGAFNSPVGYYALDSGTIGSDYYSIELQDEFLVGMTECAIEIKRNNANPDINFNFAAITPFSGANATASDITGLAYTPDPGMPDLVAYAAEYAQDRTAEPSADQLEISYIITPDWLGGNSSYILPDFSGLVGFDPLWDLTSGVSTDVGITAALYNVPIGAPLGTHTDWIPDMYMVQPKMRLTFTTP